MKKFLTRCVLEIAETVSVMLFVLAYIISVAVICAFFNWGSTGFMILLTMLAGPCIETFMAITGNFYKLKCRYGCFYR